MPQSGFSVDKTHKISGDVTRMPYLDPRATEEKERRAQQLDVDQTYVSNVQFGRFTH